MPDIFAEGSGLPNEVFLGNIPAAIEKRRTVDTPSLIEEKTEAEVLVNKKKEATTEIIFLPLERV